MSRETKRTIISQRIKLVNQLEKELKQVNKAQSELGYIVLDKPLRDGWIKTYRLRDDILRSKSARTYQEVLAAVLHEVWGREKKYADKRWKKFFDKNSRHFQRPGIRRLNEKEYNKLSSKAKKCFIQQKRKAYRGYVNIYACTLPRYYFQLSYRRAYITKRKIISPILDSREQEIMEILSRPTLRVYSVYYSYHYRHYHNPHKGDRRKIKVTLCSNTADEIMLSSL